MSDHIHTMHQVLSYIALILGGIITLKNAELFFRFSFLGKKTKSNFPLLGGLFMFAGAMLSDNTIVRYTSFIWLFTDVGCMPMVAFAIYSLIADRGRPNDAGAVAAADVSANSADGRSADAVPSPDMNRARYFAVQTITGLRIPLSAGAAVCMWLAATEGTWAIFAAICMLAILELTDHLDGRLARKWQVTGTFGELFDPYIDSISRMTVYFGLAAAGAGAWWLLLVLAVRDVSVAYIRITCLLTGRAVKSRISGKLKAGFQGAGAIILTLSLLPAGDMTAIGLACLTEFIAPTRFVIVLIVAVVTAWSAFDYLLGAVSKTVKPQA